jgi:hypothetical protein
MFLANKRFHFQSDIIYGTPSVNLLGDNINIIKENTQALPDTGMEVGLDVNAEKIEHMFLSHHQNAGQNHDTKIANRSIENVAQFKYLGTTVINQKLIHKEIKSRLN